MSLFRPRTAPLCARTVISSITRPLLQQPHLNLLRHTTPAQTACISHTATRARKVDPNLAKKRIPPSARPLAHAPMPLPTATPEQLRDSPYIINRTPFAQLPIYRAWLSGGTRQLIRIKKVNGDRQLLVSELVEKLGMDPANARINPTTLHIELKGDYYDAARDYLLERGF